MSPGILFSSVELIRSYISHIFSPMYLPFMNPDCSLAIILSIISFNLSAMLLGAILYTISKRVRGLQFLRNCFVLFSFGIHVMTPYL